MKRRIEILIIGGGQAGLCLGFYLKRKKREFLIVERNKKIGDSWIKRYDCLRFLTPWRENSLPGYPTSSVLDTYPTKDEFANYLQKYAKKFSLPILLDTNIVSLVKENNKFLAIAKKDIFVANKVIVATGPFQVPYIPPFANKLPKTIFQIHSSSYKNSKSLPKGKVLVVGAGSSGAQISVEFSLTHNTTLASKKRLFSTNKLDFAYKALNIFLKPETLRKMVNLFRIRKIQEPELVDQLKSKKLTVRSEVIDFDGSEFVFKNDKKESFDIVIWATGFKFEYDWINIPTLFNKRGAIKHTNGISSVKGLFIVYPEKDYGFIRDLPKSLKPIIERI